MPPIPKRKEKIVEQQPTQSEPTELVPYWQSECGRVTIYNGDCRDVISKWVLEPLSSIVTDPPYNISFMSNKNKWDTIDNFQGWCQQWSTLAMGISKPGTHMLAFGGPRQFHRLTCGVEDAGWVLREVICWIFAEGFPKGLDVSKGIDRLLNATRDVVGVRTDGRATNSGSGCYQMNDGKDTTMKKVFNDTIPATVQPEQWQGWNSCLKPAYEPVILARKPLTGTIAQNVLEHGVGAINVDGCRVGDRGEVQITGAKKTVNTYGKIDVPGGKELPPGRWPANIILEDSDEVRAIFPDTAKGTASGYNRESSNNDNHVNVIHNIKSGVPVVDAGSASRYFYTAKADKVDRGDFNNHSCVKPTDLMQYLCRLITPPDGLILDPFMGSGTTGVAAIAEGFRFVGIEQDAKYCDIAIGRIRLKLKEMGWEKEKTPPAKAVFKNK